MRAGEQLQDLGKRISPRRWSVAVLLFVLVLDVWYRGATFAPTNIQATGLSLWPAATGPSEPLDCDEAAYAYIGHRMLAGDVMYRDLTENKPPLGYWLYMLTVAAGGYRELAIRLMPIPFALATIGLVWWIGGRLAGPVAACLAALLYAMLSTDPFLFGNGSNMEHFMNCFSVGSLALLLLGWSKKQRWLLAAAGACLGAAALVKQVAILPGVVYVVALLMRSGDRDDSNHRNITSRVRDVLVLGLGLALAVGLAALVLCLQRAGRDAYVDIMQYGRALATDTLPEPGAPSPWLRWLTGNADPTGKLPWPFGSTNYLVWWGTGSWPLWLAAVPCLLNLVFGRGTTAGRRLVAGWTIAAALQVVLPGLYWQHYYLLPTPGIALVVAIGLADCLALSLGVKKVKPRRRLPALAWLSAVGLALAIAGTLIIQVRSYLLVPPQELTVRYKGGGQWVALRTMGNELARRTLRLPDARLYVWGWQSPLHFYGKLDGVTRHFFVDNLLRDQAQRDHPLIKPRIAEIMGALRANPPTLIFAGYQPFPELRSFLLDRYLPSQRFGGPGGLGLWVLQKQFAAFEGPQEGWGSRS
jgi:4-amino-4-deoxy-L-arabinose transferase-like glycosyltransferase